MDDSRRIAQLLERMLDSESTPDQVCADCPELLPALNDRWRRLWEVDAQVRAIFPVSGHLPPNGSAGRRPLLAAGLPVITGYDVEGILGRGGSGVVYRARHLRLERTVALKMLLSGAYAGPHEVARFAREAKIIASLRHPNLVQVHDVGDVAGCPYFTMELVEGGSLAGQLNGVPQPPARCADVVATLALAVQAAHDGGIVHRDLKPSNVLVTGDGGLKVSDFGLARRVEVGSDVTRSGDRVGTPSYMAPEQVTNRTGEVGPPADLYALGAILYEMLTGRPPFRADTAADTERQLVADEPARPSRLNTKVPRDLETICLKCLQKDPGRRYASAAALAADLRRFAGGEPIAARPVGAPERVGKWVRRRPALAVTLASAFALALVITGGTVWIAAEASARTRGVAAGLHTVAALERRGRWEEARAAAARARLELASHGPADLRRRLDECDRDLDLVARLEIIQYDQMGVFGDPKGTWGNEAYVAAFGAYGIVPFSADKTAAVARIERSPIRIALVATLDQWGMVTDSTDHRDWLLEVARAADEDQTPWQRSARDPRHWTSLVDFEPVMAAAPISDRSVSLLYALAWNYRLLHQSPIPFLTRIQQRFPTDLRANLMLGLLYGEKDKGAESLRYFQAAVAARPRKAIAECNLGAVLYMAGRRDEAIVHYRNAIELQPSIPRFRINLATALSNAGQTQQGVEQLQIAVAQSPRDAMLFVELGRSFDRLSDRKQANDAYRTALSLDPTLTVPPCNGRGAMRGIAALEQLWPGMKKSIEADPPAYAFWPTYLTLSLFLDHEGDYRSARTRLLKHADEIADPETAARCSRACLLIPASEADTRTAMAMIERVAKLDVSKHDATTKHYVSLTLALAELRLGHPQRTVDLLQGDPSAVLLPMSQLVLATAQQQIGQSAKAHHAFMTLTGTYDWDRKRAIDPEAWSIHVLHRQAEAIIDSGQATNHKLD